MVDVENVSDMDYVDRAYRPGGGVLGPGEVRGAYGYALPGEPGPSGLAAGAVVPAAGRLGGPDENGHGALRTVRAFIVLEQRRRARSDFSIDAILAADY